MSRKDLVAEPLHINRYIQKRRRFEVTCCDDVSRKDLVAEPLHYTVTVIHRSGGASRSPAVMTCHVRTWSLNHYTVTVIYRRRRFEVGTGGGRGRRARRRVVVTRGGRARRRGGGLGRVARCWHHRTRRRRRGDRARAELRRGEDLTDLAVTLVVKGATLYETRHL